MRANLPIPMDVHLRKSYQLLGASPPRPPDQGLCPWTPLGAPPDPRYRLALHALAMGLRTPKVKCLATSLITMMITMITMMMMMFAVLCH